MSKAEDSEQLRNKLEGIKHFSSSGFLVWCADHFPMRGAPSSTGWQRLTIPTPRANTNAATDKRYNTAPPPPPPPSTFFSKSTPGALFLKVLINNRSRKRLLFILKLKVSIVFPTIITIKVYKTKGTVL